MRRTLHWQGFRRVSLTGAIVALSVCVFTGCRRKNAHIPTPPAVATAPQKRPAASAPATVPPQSGETGFASWYGHPFHGRRTANGEVYDMDKFTAAHRSMMFNTWVRVHNLDNGKTVDVRINDRGPFVDNRIIDLSRIAARRIEMIGPGTALVRLEPIASPSSSPATRGSDRTASSKLDFPPSLVFGVQVGAFASLDNAERLRDRMESRYGSVRLIPRDGDPPVWRVVVGALADRAAAEQLAARIRTEFGRVLVVEIDPPSGGTH